MVDFNPFPLIDRSSVSHLWDHYRPIMLCTFVLQLKLCDFQTNSFYHFIKIQGSSSCKHSLHLYHYSKTHSAYFGWDSNTYVNVSMTHAQNGAYFDRHHIGLKMMGLSIIRDRFWLVIIYIISAKYVYLSNRCYD